MISKTQNTNAQRQSFLLTFFDTESGYSFKEVNGFVLVKQWNGNGKRWQVAIYPKDKWGKARSYLEGQRDERGRIERLMVED